MGSDKSTGTAVWTGTWSDSSGTADIMLNNGSPRKDQNFFVPLLT